MLDWKPWVCPGLYQNIPLAPYDWIPLGVSGKSIRAQTPSQSHSGLARGRKERALVHCQYWYCWQSQIKSWRSFNRKASCKDLQHPVLMRQWLSPRVKITGTRFVCCQDNMGWGVVEGGSRLSAEVLGPGLFCAGHQVDTGLLWHSGDAVSAKLHWTQSLTLSVLTCHIIPSPYLVRMSALVVLSPSVCLGWWPLRGPGTPWLSDTPPLARRAEPGAGSSQSSPVHCGESRVRLEWAVLTVSSVSVRSDTWEKDSISSSLI